MLNKYLTYTELVFCEGARERRGQGCERSGQVHDRAAAPPEGNQVHRRRGDRGALHQQGNHIAQYSKE